MRYPIYQINAFSKQPFGGNPACVVPLTSWPSDEKMLAIAKENAVAETAFYIEASLKIQLRWFTPEIEMDLCGHATLAAAHCMVTHRAYTKRPVHFITKAVWRGDIKTININSICLAPWCWTTLPKNIEDALSINPKVYKAETIYWCDSQADIEALKIDIDLFNQINIGQGGVIVTAPGDTHVICVILPHKPVSSRPCHRLCPMYACALLGKTPTKSSFHAYQCSQRGGELWCEDNGDRVLVSGYAFTYFAGWVAPGV